MASVDDFVRENPSLNRLEATEPANADDLKLLVEIIEVSPDLVQFAYAGIGYSVARDRVSDISLLSDTYSAGGPPSPPHVVLTISQNTRLSTVHSVAAADVVAAVPFSMLGKSQPGSSSTGLSEREREWRSRTGYKTHSDPETLDAVAGDIAFSSNSATRSAGQYDDSGLDDWCHPI